MPTSPRPLRAPNMATTRVSTPKVPPLKRQTAKLRGALCELNLAPKNACQERAEVKESAELEGGNIDCFERRLKVS
jgi:hypothetical protein